jgi:hypothetical protein
MGWGAQDLNLKFLPPPRQDFLNYVPPHRGMARLCLGRAITMYISNAIAEFSDPFQIPYHFVMSQSFGEVLDGL